MGRILSLTGKAQRSGCGFPGTLGIIPGSQEGAAAFAGTVLCLRAADSTWESISKTAYDTTIWTEPAGIRAMVKAGGLLTHHTHPEHLQRTEPSVT